MLFLTPDELHDLTGYVRVSAQKRWLATSGIRYLVRADGMPIVARAAVLETLGARPAKLNVPGPILETLN